jgi:hypothetical protein
MKPNGHDVEEARPFELVDGADFLKPITPPDYIVDGLLETRSMIGVVAPPEAGKSLLMQEIAVAVATGRDFHGRKVKRGLVVYLAGEGLQGMYYRLQALAVRYPEMESDIFPLLVSKVATSLLDPMEVDRVLLAIEAQIARYQMPLSLLVVDTLARFIGDGDESKAIDMGRYINAIDMLRGEAAAVSLHHPGHGDVTRGRGSSSWKAALDAEYSLCNAGGIVTVSCQKMKDGMKPEPFSFKLTPAATRMTRDDGVPVMSVVLESTTEMAAPKTKLTGKAQATLLAALEADKGLGIWTEVEIRKIGVNAGLHRNSARQASLGLRNLGYLTGTIAGSRLTR